MNNALLISQLDDLSSDLALLDRELKKAEYSIRNLCDGYFFHASPSPERQREFIQNGFEGGAMCADILSDLIHSMRGILPAADAIDAMAAHLRANGGENA